MSELKLEPEILITHPIVKPLWNRAPRTIYGQKWWNQARERCYNLAGYRCQVCGLLKSEFPYKKNCEAHELYATDYELGVAKFIRLVSLCPEHHAYIHYIRLASAVKDGVVSEFYANYVRESGEKILKAAGLPLRPVIPVSTVPWRDWKLILPDGTSHGSQFYNEQHCDRYYADQNQKILNRKNKYKNELGVNGDEMVVA